MKFLTIALFLGVVFSPSFASASLPEPDSEEELFRPFRLVANLTFDRFEQQVKQEIGGAKGQKLVEDNSLALHVVASYAPIKYVSIGVFARGDLGTRTAGNFERFDDGAPIITDETGGAYSEVWLGPLLAAHYKTFWFELGYAVVGIRSDDGRDDLPGTSGEEDSALQTSPTVAWLVAIGAGLPVLETLQVNVRLEYRVRYYDQRGGNPLSNDVVHGTQNLTPFFGVVWTPDF